ncbi:uncharacterized protein LOC129670686 [Psammomys obesus]|uniref:uncharacterized protein LOC129670686 n=1 Tax=Psammomys obesus TaxID=48139 RepID=UPI002453492B|nr:uncharacterized protein LOC129670686 [Psammomys obesus]
MRKEGNKVKPEVPTSRFSHVLGNAPGIFPETSGTSRAHLRGACTPSEGRQGAVRLRSASARSPARRLLGIRQRRRSTPPSRHSTLGRNGVRGLARSPTATHYAHTGLHPLALTSFSAFGDPLPPLVAHLPLRATLFRLHTGFGRCFRCPSGLFPLRVRARRAFSCWSPQPGKSRLFPPDSVIFSPDVPSFRLGKGGHLNPSYPVWLQTWRERKAEKRKGGKGCSPADRTVASCEQKVQEFSCCSIPQGWLSQLVFCICWIPKKLPAEGVAQVKELLIPTSDLILSLQKNEIVS